MRSAASGPFGALLMLAPLVAVPIVAVMGIPQFAPGRTAAPVETQESEPDFSGRERRSGQSVRQDADLFAPPNDSDVNLFDPMRDETGSRTGSRTSRPGRRGRSAPGWNNDSEFDEIEEEYETGPRGRGDDLFEDDRSAPTGPRNSDPRRRLRQPEDRYVDNGLTDEPEFGGDFYPDERPDTGSTRPRVRPPFNSPRFPDEEGDDANPFEPERPTGRRDSESSPQSFPNLEDEGAVADPNDAPPFQPRRPKMPVQPEPREPVRPLVTVMPEIPAPPGSTALAHDFTWANARESMKKLGIARHRFEMLEDENLFVFVCFVPVDAAGNMERFEAESDDILLAVRRTLQKVEEWRETRRTRTRGRIRTANESL